jgi:ribonucleoside-diphosphate reductase alpha chain
MTPAGSRPAAAAGVRDDLGLSPSALAILADRYLRRDERGRLVESTGEMLDRVGLFVAQAEDEYRPGASERFAEAFSGLMRRLEFLPNSPTLMNAGTALGLLSGCVVLPLEDSLEGIFRTLGQAALLHQAGGGTGYAFSHLRPRGDRVASTGGRASGPVSFLSVFDTAAAVVAEGGRRRGASMAVLDVSHPDIGEFVEAKLEPGRLETFNLSVGVWDRFLRAVEADGEHRLVNPRTGRTVARVRAAALFGQICEAALESGDPGLVFLDRVNRANPLPGQGRIEATNPCGEVPLLPYESCNLGSVNLARFVAGGGLDWERLGEAVRLAVRFLDDVIDVSRYPVPELDGRARAARKVGLGVMGLAEALAALGLAYDSPEAVALGARIARFVRGQARRASAALAEERGAFPLFGESVFARRGFPPLRNAQLTSIAPTGTISVIAGTTSGIEPMFALVYVRHVLGRELAETNPLFARVAAERGIASAELFERVGRRGGVRGDPAVPEDLQRLFVTALEVPPSMHLAMQAAFQRHVDAAVAKTVNLPPDATVADVRSIYLEAWRAGAKGITVYRYGAKPGQVLSLAGDEGALAVRGEYAGGCAGHACQF